MNASNTAEGTYPLPQQGKRPHWDDALQQQLKPHHPRSLAGRDCPLRCRQTGAETPQGQTCRTGRRAWAATCLQMSLTSLHPPPPASQHEYVKRRPQFSNNIPTPSRRPRHTTHTHHACWSYRFLHVVDAPHDRCLHGIHSWNVIFLQHNHRTHATHGKKRQPAPAAGTRRQRPDDGAY